MDLDAVSGGEWGRSMDGCIRWVVIVIGEKAVLGVNLHTFHTFTECWAWIKTLGSA